MLWAEYQHTIQPEPACQVLIAGRALSTHTCQAIPSNRYVQITWVTDSSHADDSDSSGYLQVM